MNVEAFISEEKAVHSVSKLCDVLDEPRSTFYYKENKTKGVSEDKEREIVVKKIRKIHEEGRGLYGKRRMRAALRKEGIEIGLFAVRKLMLELNLESKHRQKFKPKKSAAGARETAPAEFMFGNGFGVSGPNIAYSTDITYVKTAAGWKYLCVFLDMFSRKVVGHSFSERMDTSLVVSALEQAIQRNRPGSGLIIHSDRGSQYTSKLFTRFCASHGFIQSMSGKGACFDNAITETFNATIKKELVYQCTFAGFDKVRIAIFDYIEAFYNRKRLHSSLDYMSPLEYEEQAA